MFRRCWRTLDCRALTALCFLLPFAVGLAQAAPGTLRSLALEQDLVEAELAQLRQTVALLRASQGPDSVAVQRLQDDIRALKQQLIDVSRRQIALLESDLEPPSADERASAAQPGPQVLESKPLPTTPSPRSEQAQVARLQALLLQHHSEASAAQQVAPSAEELEQRNTASRDAVRLARIPFNANKVRLSGPEGSSALAQISARLADPDLPESRRDSAPVVSVKTHLFGTLIASENRALHPVGKYHYIARQRLQPGTTTVRMQGYHWEVALPEDLHTREYLLALYKPPGAAPTLHVFAIDEWLAADDAHIPAWLPAEYHQPNPR